MLENYPLNNMQMQAQKCLGLCLKNLGYVEYLKKTFFFQSQVEA